MIRASGTASRPGRSARSARPAKLATTSAKKNTLWIVDFDYTLFDLYRLMDDFGVILTREFGVVDATYRQTKVDVQKKMLYSFERHVRAMQKELNLPHKEVMRRIKMFLERSRRYFFKDALPFMRAIAKQGEVVLLSHGHAGHQRGKIAMSGIEKYCNRVVITSTKEKKAERVRKFAQQWKGRKIMVVNDDPEETHMILAALIKAPTAAKMTTVILVERPEGKYFPIPPHKGYTIVKDLREILALQ